MILSDAPYHGNDIVASPAALTYALDVKRNLIRPAALRPGDTIGIVAPAGPLQDREALEGGLATLRRLGFNVRCEDRVFESYRYLAGSDAARADELVSHIENDEIRGIIALRGGYGCARLLRLLDLNRIRSHCKVLMGFSDFTTLHLFFQKSLGWVTFHGPMATSATLINANEEQERHLLALWTDPTYRPRLSFPSFRAWHGGTAKGPIVGGCLSLIVASLGTPGEIETDGAILFIEDLGEAPYRVDRMLTQLHLAGKLDRLAGILIGDFQDNESSGDPCTVEEVLHETLGNLSIPILSGFPAGHGRDNIPFPLGVTAAMDADSCALEFLEPAVK